MYATEIYILSCFPCEYNSVAFFKPVCKNEKMINNFYSKHLNKLYCTSDYVSGFPFKINLGDVTIHTGFKNEKKCNASALILPTNSN